MSRFASAPDLAALAHALGRPQREGRQWRAVCPVCRRHTLTIRLSDDGQTYLVKCWSGCSQQAVVEALRRLNLWPSLGRNGHVPTAAGEQAVDGACWWERYTSVPWSEWHVWGAQAIPGGVAFTWPSLPGVRKLRLANGPKGVWKGSPTPPLWPELPGELPETIWLTEGESDAGVLRHVGLQAFACTKGAAGGLPSDVLAELRRRGCRTVTIAFDADDAGRQGAEKLALAATTAGLAVTVVSWDGLLRPELGEKDCRDLFRRLGDPEALRQALEAAARPWAPEAEEAESDAGDVGNAEESLPPFPIGAIPEPHRSYLQQAAAALDCDTALVGVPYLAIAAGVLGCRVELQLTRSWTERAILWTAVVAPPGSAKSPALRLSMHPMLALQHEAYQRWQEEVVRYEAEKRAYDQERAATKRSGGGSGGGGHLPLSPPSRPPEPPAELEHYYTADCTLEALTRMLGHPRSCTPGLTVVRDELVSWVKAFDAYSPKGERQVWLSMWAGAPVKSDRAHRETYVIPRPAVSVTGGMTPDLLPALEEEAGQRDGFLERLLFSVPPCRPMALVDTEIAPEVQQAVQAALAALRTCPEGTTRLSPEAYAIYAAWHRENATVQGRATGLLLGFAAKLPGHVARLALVLHALAHPKDPAWVPVSRETMAGAIALGEYFRAHFVRVARHFGVAGTVQDSAALRLYRTLQRLGGSATGRELADAGLRAGPERDRAVQTLQAAGLLSVTTERPAGPGRPTLRFVLTGAAPGAELGAEPEGQGNLANLANLLQGALSADPDEERDGPAPAPASAAGAEAEAGATQEFEEFEEFEV